MQWQNAILSMIKEREQKKIALAIDTSTVETRTILINNIVKLFGEVNPDTILVQADFKIRSVTPVQESEIKWYKHGKASYTEVLEWGEDENIDTLFYITDVTGYFYDDLKVGYEVIWLIPDDFLPRVPFGRAIKVA
jgi:hypothetical protein